MGDMFSYCANLTSLDVSELDTSNVTNMNHMFAGCKSLPSLDVSGFDTSNVTNMNHMFVNLSLPSLDVSGFNTSNVTDMGHMFYNCNLPSLDVSGFDTSKVTDMTDMFSGCTDLTSLDVSGFNTSNVTGMGGMFSGCLGLTSLNVSGFNTSNVTNMESMFNSCSSLTSLDVSGLDTSKVTNMQGMFSRLNLTSLDVSGFNTSKVTNMYCMFYSCSDLTSLDVSGFNTSKVTNMTSMFYGCSDLASLDVSGFDTSKVTRMKNMFSKCPVLSALSIGQKTRLNNDCGLSASFDPSKFTGKWTLDDPYKHTNLLSVQELITRTQGSGGAPGLWVADRAGTDPRTQGYTSISANRYDAASHMNADGSIKAGEDPVSLYRTNDSGSGYWQKLADGRWAYTFFVFKNDETNWQVWEDGIPNYTGNYTIANPLELAGSKIQEGEQPVITNTKNNGPTDYKMLTLTKKTISPIGSEITVDKAFDFTITLSGANISGSQVFGDTAFVNGTAKVKLKGGETISFTDIPAGTAYKIEEDPDSNFTSSIDNPTGIITYKDDVSVICTNTKKDEQKDYVSFSVKKEVSSNADESNTEFSFHAALSGCEQSATYSLSDGTKYTSDSDGNANVDFTLKQDQTITFQNIPVGSKYTITEDGGDYLSSYKITDSAGVNKIVSSTGKSVQAEDSLSTALESVDKGENVLITFQNNITRTQNLIIAKKSVKADGSVNEDDNNQYLIDIILTGLSGGQKIKTSNGVLIADDDGIIESSMYITPSQRLILFDVPVGVKYKFTEEANDKTAAYKLTNAAKTIDFSEYSTPSEISDEIASFLDGRAETETVSSFNFMKASSEVKDHKAQLRLDFYTDPGDNAEKTVYLDTGITETEYNKMDAATRDHDVLNALSLPGNPTIVSNTGANTAANTSLATAEETVDAGENITVAFTNTAPKAAKLKVTKYDNTANKHKLGGAEFTLYKADGTPVNFTADGSNVITIGTNGESEVLDSPLFIEGSYYLVETKAPDGYTVSGEPKTFQITAADAGKTLQIEVYDDKLIVFPVTGGEGNRYILSIACILAAAAVAMIIYRKRQRAVE